MDDEEKQRRRKLLEAMMDGEGLKTLNTDYETEEHEKEKLAQETQQDHSVGYCYDCDGEGKCSSCSGTGTEECTTCFGSGRVGGGHRKVTYAVDHVYIHQASGFGGTCPDCHGSGIKTTGIFPPKAVECDVCKGSGKCLKCDGTGSG